MTEKLISLAPFHAAVSRKTCRPSVLGADTRVRLMIPTESEARAKTPLVACSAKKTTFSTVASKNNIKVPLKGAILRNSDARTTSSPWFIHSRPSGSTNMSMLGKTRMTETFAELVADTTDSVSIDTVSLGDSFNWYSSAVLSPGNSGPAAMLMRLRSFRDWVVEHTVYIGMTA